MSATPSSMTDLINLAMDSRLGDLHVMMPGSIESYDAGQNKATVKPQVKRRFRDGEALEYPVVTDVPVVFPRTQAAILHLPIAAGDTGALVFGERAIDTWLNGAANADPEDTRSHDLSDAVFIPGLLPFGAGPIIDNDDLLLKLGTDGLRVQNGKFAIGTATTELVDLLSRLTAILSTDTAGGSPLAGQAAYAALKTELDAVKTIL